MPRKNNKNSIERKSVFKNQPKLESKSAHRQAKKLSKQLEPKSARRQAKKLSKQLEPRSAPKTTIKNKPKKIKKLSESILKIVSKGKKK